MSKSSTERERDLWFNPYRYPATERATLALGNVISELEHSEQRKRARKATDRTWFWKTTYAVLSDLAYYSLNGYCGDGLIGPRAKAALGITSRYFPPLFTQSFPKLLDELERYGYLKQTKGFFSGIPGKSKRTTIRPDSALIALIDREGFAFSDFALGEHEEVIILKRSKTGYDDEGGTLEYEDNTTTRALRSAVRELNSWLEKAEIAFDSTAYDYPVDARARRLFRYFAEGRFDRGGRLFRGFWENLPKKARLGGITIEGERVVELDYAQLNPTLAYAEVGATAPAGDAYVLRGFEQHRDGVKKIFNALLFDRKQRKSFPKGTKELFSPGTKVGDVITAICVKHRLLTSVLSRGRGFHLMFVESEVMMAVLRELARISIVALPVFDAVIVKASAAETAQAVMKDQFRKRTGLDIQIRLELGGVASYV
jgi:hypothetical protein